MPGDNHQTQQLPPQANNQQGSQQQQVGGQPNQSQGNQPPAKDGTQNQGQTNNRGRSVYSAPEDGGNNQQQQQSGWGDDWRARITGNNAEKMKQIERLGTPEAIVDSLLAAQQKIRTGEYKANTPKPDGKDPAVLEAWLAERSIPKDAAGYELKFDNVDLSKLDPAAKKGLDTFLGIFHGADVPQAQAQQLANGLLKMGIEQNEAQAERDATEYDGNEDDLRASWGPEYRNNLAMNAAFMKERWGDEWETYLEARLPNGTKLGNSPMFNKFLNDMARANGGDLIYDGSGGGGKNDDARITEIESWLASPSLKAKHYTNAVADEYAKLLDRKEARKARQ